MNNDDVIARSLAFARHPCTQMQDQKYFPPAPMLRRSGVQGEYAVLRGVHSRSRQRTADPELAAIANPIRFMPLQVMTYVQSDSPVNAALKSAASIN